MPRQTRPASQSTVRVRSISTELLRRSRRSKERSAPASPKRDGRTSDGVSHRVGGTRLVTVETPGWVRDAVFYQIFPDRFASSPRVPKPGEMEPWDAPPSNHGIKGGDLFGVA